MTTEADVSADTVPEKNLLIPGEASAPPHAPASELPPELMEHAVRRLGLFAAVVAAAGSVEGLQSHLFVYYQNPQHYPRLEDVWDLLFVVLIVLLSLAMFWTARARVMANHKLIGIGHVYLVFLAYLVSCTDHVDYFWKDGGGLHGMPAVVIFILIFPVLVPCSPRRALIVAGAMALTGPLSLYTLSAGLHYEPPPLSALHEAFPWVAALVAPVLAKIVHQLGTDLRRARTLGSYVLEARLGAGGMGEVYRARHHLLARPAAIKLIRPVPTPSFVALERFKREAISTARLKSPHTVQLYDFGTSQDGSLYYVMELLDGYDLERFIDKFGPQPPDRVAYFLEQICHSLREAHRAGLVHRDIKPANLVVCRYGCDDDFIKLVDFGLVTFSAPLQTGDGKLSVTGTIRGTPAYMAPELALHNDSPDGRSDLYALGCVAFWLLTGRYVFERKSPIEVIVAHVEQAPPRPSTFAPDPVPEALEQLILACLAKSPEDRPASADAILQTLQSSRLSASWTVERARAWWNAHAGARHSAGEGAALASGSVVAPVMRIP
jgi:serine/threonine-protein kinase